MTAGIPYSRRSTNFLSASHYYLKAWNRLRQERYWDLAKTSEEIT